MLYRKWPLVVGGNNQSEYVAASSDNLQDIALHAGRFVKWYVDKVQPLCNQYYGRLNCIPIVQEVKLGGTCGARVTGQVPWPSDLPDGRIYLVEMHSAQGDPPRYRQISPGSRHDELPDRQLLSDCWDLR